MLKNNFNSFKLKNFFKTGMYIDFFLKKKINKKLNKINKIGIFFLDKTLLEDLFLFFYTFIYIYFLAHISGIFLKKNFLINFIKLFVILIHIYFIFF